MTRIHCLLTASAALSFALAAGTAGAQENADEKPAKGWLRLLPLGEDPPFRQEIRDGVRYELPPEPGSVPPPEVRVLSLEEQHAVPLRLGVVTKPLLAFVGSVKVAGKDGGGDWQQLVMPAAPAALALFWRDPDARDWDKARSLVLADDPRVFQPGRVRIVNVAPVPVAVSYWKEVIALKPGQHVYRGKGVGQELNRAPLSVAIRDKHGDWMRIFDSEISFGRGERANIVIFRADGDRPRRPAKVLILPEIPDFPKIPK